MVLPSQQNGEGVRIGESSIESGRLTIRGYLEFENPEEFLDHLHQGHINETTWTLGIGSSKLFTRHERIIIQIERRSWYDPFLKVYVVSDTTSPSDYHFSEDFQTFWEHWSRFDPDPILIPSVPFSLKRAHIYLEARIEPYQLNPSLWILRPFLGSRVKVHRSFIPLSGLES